MTECCEPKRNTKKFCPRCGRQGKPVQRITLESLLKDPSKIQDESYWFCAGADCPVVYFSENLSLLFFKPDLKVRVGIKEKEDPIPLCYCFHWDRQRIRDEIRQTGKSTAVQSISEEVKAGRCFCERSNPQGSCCLGNISRAIKESIDGNFSSA